MTQEQQLAALELRILSGMHAGARAPLEGEHYVIGAKDDCDFVLTDEGVQPRHARLSRRHDGWQLDWVAQEGTEPVLAPMRLEAGKAVPLGPIVVAVDEPEARWPTLEQLVLVPHAPALEPSLPPPAGPMPQEEPLSRAALFKRPAVAFAAVSVFAGMSALAFVASPMGVRGEVEKTGGPPVASAPAQPVPNPAQRQAIESALRQAGMTERVKVEAAGGGWVVRAPVLNDSEAEALTAALARIQPRPALRMTTEQDLRDAVSDMLVRLAPEYRGSVNLRYLGEGRFRLEGRMAKAAERDKLLRALSSAFPEVHEWDNAVVAGEDSAARFLAALRSPRWDISSEWDKGTLEMDVKLQQPDVSAWERTLEAAAKAESVPFHARLDVVQQANAHGRSDARLPFQIRGVIGGDMPYVVLPDGERLGQGGTWQGWRLAAVSSQEVVFENGARRAVLRR